MSETESASETYAMGRTPEETQRLQLQSSVYRRHSEELLRRAGVRPGMRVLDVGCGPGDVSLLLAGLVGPTGAVVAVDIDEQVLAVARQRADDAGFADRIEFRQDDIAELGLDEPVDALVGRIVVLHLADRAGTLEKLRRLVRPGGIVTFQEVTLSAYRSAPSVPLIEQARDWMIRALLAVGTEPCSGDRLASVFHDAGLPLDDMAASVPVYASVCDLGPAVDLTVATVRVLAPLLTGHGIATTEELGLDTLEERLMAQLTTSPTTVFMPELVAAWGRLPG